MSTPNRDSDPFACWMRTQSLDTLKLEKNKLKIVLKKYRKIHGIKYKGLPASEALYRKIDCHYQRRRRSLGIEADTPKGKENWEKRFWNRVSKVEIGCWITTMGLDDGYPIFRNRNGKVTRASRIAWELTNGPIPDKHDIHHKCQNPLCVRPDHIQPATRRKHLLELTPACAPYQNIRKTHCKLGHPFDENNIYRNPKWPNKRRCKECIKIWSREKNEKGKLIRQQNPKPKRFPDQMKEEAKMVTHRTRLQLAKDDYDMILEIAKAKNSSMQEVICLIFENGLAQFKKENTPEVFAA